MSDSVNIAQFDHFIPVGTAELIRRLQLPGAVHLTVEQRQVIQLLRQVLSYEFNLRLNDIRKLYQPLNPDNELLLPAESATDQEEVVDALRKLLVAANYSELDQEQIQYALLKSSPYGLEIGIDFDDFDHVSLFYRGKSQTSVEFRDWRSAYLKKKSLRMINYQRLFLVVSFKQDRGSQGLHLKLFKNIPRPDLEMLFPNSRVRMKIFDKLKIAVTGGGGTVGGLFATIGKISAAISPWTIVLALAGFGALLWRQVSKVFTLKTRYMATLAQNLYFHNLDNNAGAITYLVDMARQEEIKEAIFAYAMLCGHESISMQQLDDSCEKWFDGEFDRSIDFDIEDAVGKLRRLGVVVGEADSLRCSDSQETVSHLRDKWMDFVETRDR